MLQLGSENSAFSQAVPCQTSVPGQAASCSLFGFQPGPVRGRFRCCEPGGLGLAASAESVHGFDMILVRYE